ncbi:hypothetical protein Cfor_05242 [Coptotermes formosanus]|uniref:Reverse transcriptase domain-containing protein n=1 Tax=Coptotermes formosanus TaxID=36987 RepID=A0A6L2PW55_COPFO|nr:hypothetical protein Cfor_05242 [Coptotermes formosanus]
MAACLKSLNSGTIEDRIEYKHKRAIVRKLSRKLQNESWELFIRNLEKDVKGAQRYGFKVFRRLQEGCTYRIAITGIRGEKWREYYLKILHNVNETKTTTYTTEGYNAISLSDVMQVLNNMQNRKASGVDNTPMELWKYSGKVLCIRIVQLVNDIWAQGKITSDWKTSLPIPIHKKGDKSVYSNYRGISLLATASKIYAAILKDKLKTIAEEKIEEEQFGFRKSGSCINAVFVIKQLMEKRKEFNCPLYMLLLDYEKAYDQFNRQKL